MTRPAATPLAEIKPRRAVVVRGINDEKAQNEIVTMSDVDWDAWNSPGWSTDRWSEVFVSSHTEQEPRMHETHVSSTPACSCIDSNEPDRPLQPDGLYHTDASYGKCYPESEWRLNEKHNDTLYSPFELYRRHAHLDRQQWPEQKTVESVLSPETDAAIMSPKTLTPNEKRGLLEAEQSQQEDDRIRMVLASDGLGEKRDLQRKYVGAGLDMQPARHIKDRGRTFTPHTLQFSGS